MIRLFTLVFVCAMLSVFQTTAQFASIENLNPVQISTNTGEKPQSKVWSHGGKYWAVLSSSNGTHLWRLDGTEWTNMLQLSPKKSSKADAKLAGDMAHVLLYQGTSSEMASLEYDPETSTYKFWSKKNLTRDIKLDKGVETATIDIDGHGRMWLASDGENSINVRWSDSPYDFWSDPIPIATGMQNDDISAIIALPGKIGVLWSNQNTRKFGFRTHIDGADPAAWSMDEEPASQSALNVGGGMADDHLNMAVANDGTLYAAVKTSYNNSRYPEVALLVRRPSGNWDDLYEVDTEGTRPIVLLNELEGKVRIIYTESNSGGDILYKETLTSAISFGNALTLIEGNSTHRYNNATSTKANFSEDIVVLASSSTQAVGVLASSPIIPLPVELVSFTAQRMEDDVLLQWKTASEQDNDFFSVESSTDGKNFAAIGTVPGNGTTQLERQYTFTDRNVSRYRAGQLYYRLRQVDFSGKAELSAVRFVQPPFLEETLSLRAFPNPFADYIQVKISSYEDEQASLILYNAQGEVVLSQQPQLKAGLNHLHLQDVRLLPGIYFLHIRTGSQQQVAKLLRE